MRYRTLPLTVVLCGLFLLPVSLVHAQTPADLFDGSILHAAYLEMNPSDWQSLKQNYLANTYYPADLRWVFGDRLVEARRVGVRSRGSGGRSPVKPGLSII